MNLFISIFGGMFLTALVYGVSRRLRLSNFWAAVSAAAMPSLAYMIYAVFLWPGLDVVTMHVIAYPTVAVLLFQLYGEKGSQFAGVHWAPKLMIAFFLALTVVLGGFVYIAGQGLPPALASLLLPNAQGRTVHTGFAGVVEHGEDAAKTIGQHRKMDHKLAQLGWQVEVVGVGGLQPGRSSEVSILLRGRNGEAIQDARVQLELGRPGQKPEQSIALPWRGADTYRAQAGLPAGGAWLATLVLEARGERIVLEHGIGE